jgi:ABC-type lipoprotein release transport system permease subunit
MNTPDGGGAIRNSLRTVLRGFLLGIGLSIALGVTYVIAMQWTMNKTRAEFADMTAEFSNKDIVLSEVEEQKHDGATWIIGNAKNVGKRTARSVEVQANLFLHGKFVDQYSTSISGKMNPGDSKYFKIACGCKESPPAEHDSFKVEVVSGY